MPKFVNYINIKDIPAKGKMIDWQSTESFNTEIAARLMIPKINTFKAQGLLAKNANLYQLNAKIQASVVLQCVLTLEEFTLSISEDFEISFSFDQDSMEHEPIIDNKIDIAEQLLQSLSLALPDFPKKPENV